MKNIEERIYCDVCRKDITSMSLQDIKELEKLGQVICSIECSKKFDEIFDYWLHNKLKKSYEEEFLRYYAERKYYMFKNFIGVDLTKEIK